MAKISNVRKTLAHVVVAMISKPFESSEKNINEKLINSYLQVKFSR